MREKITSFLFVLLVNIWLLSVSTGFLCFTYVFKEWISSFCCYFVLNNSEKKICAESIAKQEETHCRLLLVCVCALCNSVVKCALL